MSNFFLSRRDVSSYRTNWLLPVFLFVSCTLRSTNENEQLRTDE
jgi:hypothetical protein